MPPCVHEMSRGKTPHLPGALPLPLFRQLPADQKTVSGCPLLSQ